MAKFTVGGIPLEQLTEEQQQEVVQRATQVVAGVVTEHVQHMIDEGKSLEEIKKFLGLDKEANHEN